MRSRRVGEEWLKKRERRVRQRRDREGKKGGEAARRVRLRDREPASALSDSNKDF